MLRDERLELRYQLRVPAESEVGIDPPLKRDQTKILQPFDLVPGELLEREVRKRRPAPQSKGASKLIGTIVG